MKALILLVLPLAILVGNAGCDESSLPAELKALVAAHPVAVDLLPSQTQSQDRIQLRRQLHDGTCDGSGNQYGGANGSNPGNGGSGSGGNGDGTRDRLRDGSCAD